MVLLLLFSRNSAKMGILLEMLMPLVQRSDSMWPLMCLSF